MAKQVAQNSWGDLKASKVGAIGYNFRIPIGDRMLLPLSAAQLTYFRAKAQPGNAVRMIETEAGCIRFNPAFRTIENMAIEVSG